MLNIDPKITEESIKYKEYINKTWSQFDVQVEQKLNQILPKPTNKGLLHIWKYGSADLVIRKDGYIVCIIEPGGGQHLDDEKQIKNDRRKWKLCQLNGIKCMKVMNGVLDNLSNNKKRKMIGKFLFTSRKFIGDA